MPINRHRHDYTVPDHRHALSLGPFDHTHANLNQNPPSGWAGSTGPIPAPWASSPYSSGSLGYGDSHMGQSYTGQTSAGMRRGGGVRKRQYGGPAGATMNGGLSTYRRPKVHQRRRRVRPDKYGRRMGGAMSCPSGMHMMPDGTCMQGAYHGASRSGYRRGGRAMQNGGTVVREHANTHGASNTVRRGTNQKAHSTNYSGG
jgi:hypothetical protein